MTQQGENLEDVVKIGQKIKVEGDLKGLGNIIIDGFVEGNVETNEDVFIGEQARVNANIKAKNAEISGEDLQETAEGKESVLSK